MEAAPPVVQVSSSASGEEGGWEEEEDEEEESEASSEGPRRLGGGEARVSAREGKASASGGEPDGTNLPSCPICMLAWTADGAHRVR